MTRDQAAKEGMIIKDICRRHMFAVPEGKVSNGLEFPARQWPIEAMRIWWPNCCERWGWRLEWKV